MQNPDIEIECNGVRTNSLKIALKTSLNLGFANGGLKKDGKGVGGGGGGGGGSKKAIEPDRSQCMLSLLVEEFPREDKYAPPLNIRLYDNKKFGRRPLVGVHTVKVLNSLSLSFSPLSVCPVLTSRLHDSNSKFKSPWASTRTLSRRRSSTGKNHPFPLSLFALN
jgi:hypothetical protein